MSEIDVIRNLVHCYCDAVCNDDRDALKELWAEDAIWNVGRGPVVGKTAIGKAVDTAMDLFESVNQMTFNGTADLKEDSGVGRWYMCEFAKARSGKPLFYLGYYDDIYVKESAGWLFKSRQLTWLYQGPPNLSGVFGPPEGYEEFRN
ncbi:MAG: nuclear transport factor 2 family protein [Actinomycetota bacterium]|jgi:ketosteroid isomerase-like protein|nr:nuclear transport factor 2 family protein [Acidimicrobiales bacterium]